MKQSRTAWPAAFAAALTILGAAAAGAQTTGSLTLDSPPGD